MTLKQDYAPPLVIALTVPAAFAYGVLFALVAAERVAVITGFAAAVVVVVVLAIVVRQTVARGGARWR